MKVKVLSFTSLLIACYFSSCKVDCGFARAKVSGFYSPFRNSIFLSDPRGVHLSGVVLFSKGFYLGDTLNPEDFLIEERKGKKGRFFPLIPQRIKTEDGDEWSEVKVPMWGVCFYRLSWRHWSDWKLYLRPSMFSFVIIAGNGIAPWVTKKEVVIDIKKCLVYAGGMRRNVDIEYYGGEVDLYHWELKEIEKGVLQINQRQKTGGYAVDLEVNGKSFISFRQEVAVRNENQLIASLLAPTKIKVKRVGVDTLWGPTDLDWFEYQGKDLLLGIHRIQGMYPYLYRFIKDGDPMPFLVVDSFRISSRKD